jgi:hypothetical protein
MPLIFSSLEEETRSDRRAITLIELIFGRLEKNKLSSSDHI